MRGVQGAALRRQRERAHRRGTAGSLPELAHSPVQGAPPAAPNSTGCAGITLFHIGLVLLFIGFLLVITAMIPGYVAAAKTYDLVGTGTFFVLAGAVLTIIHRVLVKREDDNLKEYVSGRLARSKSGGRLIRDPESGLTPEIHRRAASHTRSHSRRASRVSRSPEPTGGKRRGSRLTASPPAELAVPQVNSEQVHVHLDGDTAVSTVKSPLANNAH